MFIKKVTLKDFRNYRQQTVELDPGLNIFAGENASGKTNFAESVYFAALGKSPRTNHSKEMINWSAKQAYINLTVGKKFRDHEITLLVDNKDKKKLLLDGLPCSRISDLVGVLNVVYFSPDELKMIKDGPQERRRFIDISLCQQSKNYLYSLQKYNNVLAQRNKLLKSGFGVNTLKETLFVWDAQLAKYGAYIIRKRYDFIEKLKKLAFISHDKLSGGKEKLALSYECALGYDDEEELEKQFSESLKASFLKDTELFFTTFGCHRDDMDITVDGIDVRKYGSQGQQRSAALSLKFAEIDLFGEETGEKPVLLLDDVLSELDENRRSELIKMSSSIQTIITCTEFDEKADHTLFNVSAGTITRPK